MDDYYRAVAYLESLGNITGGYQKINLTAHPHPEMYLERMQDFLNLLGNPETHFNYIHITGTSGKGSVSSAIHAALVKSGKKAGLFTSPFVVSTIEKIQVGTKYIDPKSFVKITETLKSAIDKSILEGRHGVPSYFELMLAIAFIYFKQEKCEYVVLEVGLGGRYDATNIIQKPLITAITNIDLDHTNILGSTKEAIAQDKSGIIKKDSAFYTTEEMPDLLEIFKSVCQKVGAVFTAIPVENLNYGERNKILVEAICKKLGIKPPAKTPQLSARFETMSKKPLVIIDGAHNPSKIKSTLSNLTQISFKKIFLVFASSGDKDWKTMVAILAPKADKIFVTRFNTPGRNSVNPKELYIEIQKYSKEVELHSDPIQAFEQARDEAGKDDIVLVVGSFYLAGDIRALYCPEKKILKQRNSKI